MISNNTASADPGTRMAYEVRASAVLFNLLRSFRVSGTFLLPANVCPVVPLTFMKVNRPFELIDISPETLCMDTQHLIRRWERKSHPPAGLLYVRSYGAIFDESSVFDKLKLTLPHALIIDDRCLCPPSFENALPSSVDAILYSTGYAKFADVGFGGFAVLGNHVDYASSALSFSAADLAAVETAYKDCLSNHRRYHYQDADWLDTRAPDVPWVEYRRRVEDQVLKRRELTLKINAIYDSANFQTTPVDPIFQQWRYNVNVHTKDKIIAVIREHGLFASSHYQSLAGLFDDGVAPVAAHVEQGLINLFNDHHFDEDRARVLSNVLTDLKNNHPEYFK